jgi:hypothetical protein
MNADLDLLRWAAPLTRLSLDGASLAPLSASDCCCGFSETASPSRGPVMSGACNGLLGYRLNSERAAWLGDQRRRSNPAWLQRTGRAHRDRALIRRKEEHQSHSRCRSGGHHP